MSSTSSTPSSALSCLSATSSRSTGVNMQHVAARLLFTHVRRACDLSQAWSQVEGKEERRLDGLAESEGEDGGRRSAGSEEGDDSSVESNGSFQSSAGERLDLSDGKADSQDLVCHLDHVARRLSQNPARLLQRPVALSHHRSQPSKACIPIIHILGPCFHHELLLLLLLLLRGSLLGRLLGRRRVLLPLTWLLPLLR